MTKRKFHLVIIDPQNDFCDLPEAYRPELPRRAGRSAPALPVPGAHADMLQLAGIIERAGAGLNAITVTLDSHQRVDIAHPTFWQTGAGQPVPAFTQIASADVRAGTFVPRLVGARDRALAYLEALEAKGRYRHMVWPVHCEIGSWGHNVHADLRAAYNAWEERTLCSVKKLVKGTNPWTEHYSAIEAEVPDADDASTLTNTGFVDELRDAECVFIAGEAGSHCVKATTEHLVAHLQPSELSRLVLVTDCMSPVAGFEAPYADFVAAMVERGLRVARAADVERALLDNAGPA